jgi:hypothetical protein
MDERKENSETTQQLINQAIGLAGTLIGMYIARKMMQDGFGTAFKMRAALTVKRVAQQQADAWQAIADNAATTYQKVRL